MYSFADLTRPLTREECQEAIYTAIAMTGISTTSWKPGAVVRTMIVGVSAVMSAFTQLTAAIAKSGFLELSEGDWLTLVAYYVYGVEKLTATYAAGTVTLTNAGGGEFLMGPGDLIVSSTYNGKSYRNVASFTLGALGSVDVEVIATEVGAASSTPAGTVTIMTTTLNQVSCTNAAPLEGRDDETDPELKQRCYEMLGALSPNGPWDAYSYVIKSARRSDKTPIGVKRVRLTKDGKGNVNLYCATSTGGVLPSDIALLQVEVDKKSVPQCVNALVASAVERVIDVTNETWIYNTSAQTPDQIKAAIAAKLKAYVNAQPVGGNVLEATTPPTGKIFTDALRAVIGASVPGLIVHTTLTTPAVDPVLNANEVPVLGIVTTILHQIPTPEGYSA